MNQPSVLPSYLKFILTETINLLDSRYGIQQVNRSTLPSLLSTTEVLLRLTSDSQVAICVYDITNKNSFEKMKQWVEDLKAQGPKDLVLAVVGNKTDLIDNEKVSYEEAKNYARDNGAVFKLVSAKEGRGINVILEIFRNCLLRLQSSWI